MAYECKSQKLNLNHNVSQTELLKKTKSILLPCTKDSKYCQIYNYPVWWTFLHSLNVFWNTSHSACEVFLILWHFEWMCHKILELPFHSSQVFIIYLCSSLNRWNKKRKMKKILLTSFLIKKSLLQVISRKSVIIIFTIKCLIG